MTGTVESFPILEGSIVIEKKLQIVYIKMSVNNKELDQAVLSDMRESVQSRYHPIVVDWYASRKQASGDCDPDFPHLNTTHQNFSRQQFLAYVHLGYGTIANNPGGVPKATGTLKLMHYCHANGRPLEVGALPQRIQISLQALVANFPQPSSRFWNNRSERQVNGQTPWGV